MGFQTREGLVRINIKNSYSNYPLMLNTMKQIAIVSNNIRHIHLDMLDTIMGQTRTKGLISCH